VQRKNVVNNVDMSSLRALLQNGPHKNTEQNKHTQNTKTQQTFRINYFLCFSVFRFVFQQTGLLMLQHRLNYGGIG